MKKIVAYFRVSTKKQGKSGLGLDAQKEIVRKKTEEIGGCIVAEHTDIESGKKNNRVELLKAIDAAKKENATLMIAKLDRLSRDVEFIFRLKNSGVDFFCCDIPEVNTLSLGVFASFAQYERERIVSRIKDALKAKKDRGFKLGNPKNLTKKARENSLESRRKSNKRIIDNIKNVVYVQSLRSKGLSIRQIVSYANDSGRKTIRGKKFCIATVQRLLLIAKKNNVYDFI